MTLCDLIDALTKFRGMLRGFSFTVIQCYLKCERLIDLPFCQKLFPPIRNFRYVIDLNN